MNCKICHDKISFIQLLFGDFRICEGCQIIIFKRKNEIQMIEKKRRDREYQEKLNKHNVAVSNYYKLNEIEEKKGLK